MSVKINSENRNRKRKIDLSKMERAAQIAVKALGKDNVEVNIVFLSSQEIRVLNRTYLGADAATDVIAFPLERGTGPGDGRPMEWTGKGGLQAGYSFLGDIAISTDRAARNAGDYGTTFDEETARYVVHGALHLMGYEDTARKDRAVMREKEDEILREVRKTL